MEYNDWPQEEDDEPYVEPPFDESILTPEQKVKLDELHNEHPTFVRSDLAILIRCNLLSHRAACEGIEVTFYEEQEARALEKVIYWVPPSELEGTCVSTLEIHDVEDIHMPCIEDVTSSLHTPMIIDECYNLICESQQLDTLRAAKLARDYHDICFDIEYHCALNVHDLEFKFSMPKISRSLLDESFLGVVLDIDKILHVNEDLEVDYIDGDIVLYEINGDEVDYFVQTSFFPFPSMSSDSDRPESPSYDGKRSSLDDCTRPNDIAGPHYRSTCTIQSLQRLKELCRLPPDVMAESKMADPTESPEDHRDGYFCVYEIYFKGCGLTFPLPEALVRYLAALEISLPQLTPNLLRTILGIITVAAEAGYIIGVPELNELLSVRSSSKKAGYFSAYPNANRNIISHLPNKDENWHHPWFLIKKSPASIGNLSDVLPSKWSAKPAFIAPTLPTEDFVRFFKILLEGETIWNSFTLDRFIEANRKLRMSPPGQLQRLPPPPPSQGMSARALAAQRKKLSTPITKACDGNKALLAAAFDKKDYSRSLKRDKSSRSDSSPQREKSRARTERSPRSSPPAELMGPPPPVDMSSQHSGEKTARNVSPQKESSESQDAPPKSRPALVPQIKSLTAMEKEGSVFRCFKTRSGLILPEFDKWRPAIRERYLLHAHHSSRANSELNDMIEHYEGLLLSQQQEIELWRGKFTTLESDLQSSSGSKQQLEDRVDGLKSELEKIKGDLKDQYDQNYQLQNELSGVQGRLHESESSADALNNQLIELCAKYNAITKLRDSELARSASKARKEVKGRGMELIQGAIRFIQTEKDFAEFFTESPPLSESGLDWAGPSETEGVVSSEVPAAPKVIPGDVCTAVNEHGTSPEQVPAKEADGNPTIEVEVEVPADPPLFLSGDGFEPAGVLFPHAVFHFPSREKKEAYDFMDKWEWRNFDCIAEIPRMLRMYLRAKGQVRGPVNAPTEAALADSEEEDEENDDNPLKRVPNEPEVEGRNDMDFNLRCSESLPDFSRIGMIDEDVPNEPNRRSSPPRGFFRSQIRAPCALIRNLPIRDQGTAMAFIEALALQHRKLTLEKKRLRKRINRMQRRLTTVSRDLHILGSHPGDWIELGISDFARIPDCMMPVLDLAGQGVQVFCSPGGFS
ncbi:hypothetical protein ISN45_Aa02g004240 [Arabidopsis thaliana x Arabidopsis arenosa]|uniref:Uncharacterized protein n=1 Tax=Arabidopsis thaliana x Arabidopsis arenosa TaxID=1240361 RepID=A0A8T2BFZ4_9BRAS|nr:hypothetical protein ISN45_Aa02g004240 [Arabidopsis thaliana x Arabidopsis arenosa]